MNLHKGHMLQGSKYRIERELGHGGFGITYLATQTGLNRKVAIKEFFMSEYCERNAETSQVSVGSSGSREIVDKFRQKFIKEAQTIAALHHPYIIAIHDIFEENGTAYYVMEYHRNGSLADSVRNNGKLPEATAISYIRQLADALSYLHEQKMNHLDVKPGNILLDEKNNAVLIDFGLTKHYDGSGMQTSTTPVGISHGYAPLEQYKRGGVSTFSPATDIYSLGATLFKLVTGITPPEASDVNDEGLPALPQEISAPVRRAIDAAMQPKRKDRPQSVAEFLELLKGSKDLKDPKAFKDLREETAMPSGAQKAKAIKEQSEAIKEESEETRALEKETERATAKINDPVTKPKKNRTAWVVAVLGVLIGCVLFFAFLSSDGNDDISTSQKVDLGLSVCWAGWNVGATSPEGYGNYYAWGETTTKSDYTESSYQYHNGSYYVNIGSNISGTQYDVARAQWGGNWRMPTNAEFQELINCCTWTWTTYNGIDGYKVTGPNGKSIFLPAAGNRFDGLGGRGSLGNYWSGSLNENYLKEAYLLIFDSSSRNVGYFNRYLGRTVRPVCNK